MSSTANYSDANNESTAVSNKDEAPATNVVVPGKAGTYGSFFAITVGMIASIIAYAHAPDVDYWENGCPDDEYSDSCKANSAVLRISLALTILFGIQFIGTLCFTRFFDALWIFKTFGFFALAIGLFFADSRSFNDSGYAWFARITGFLYLILQQVILLDLAFTWNEKWLQYATNEDEERGKKWLGGILFFSFIFFAGAYSLIGVLFWQFQGCDNNIVILSLTVGLTVLATVIQLFFSEEGSILTSAIMTAYCSYIAYSAVTLNPDESCNPTLNSSYQTISSIIGLALTVISLLWTIYTTINKIPQITDSKTGEAIDLHAIATGSASRTSGKSAASTNPQDMYDLKPLRYLLAQVALIFLLVSGYYAMVLTNWATLQDSNSLSKPRIGYATMWLQASGQYIAIAIYLWSLVAPKILSNREFH